ncbi:MFS transporter [Kineosporia sp. J2-2]|uniref:MFS transporter n=1 Tax=Kineosporia corallincola TaxID=2835133 RepID=A0ABS5TQP4_9ACTN|nr:MFS transporter [Kineosporia corallincola]MBT0772829.1 MFS transporter [Kineosporia corallincola]
MLGIVTLGTFMLMLDLSVVSIALPQIHRSLHSSFSDLQWVFDAYALTLAIFLVAAGSTADRIGRKRVFQIGLVIFTAASLACGLADDALFLNISRAVQGVGAAIVFAVGPALLGHEFHGKERATAFTAFGGAIGLAVASGPLIGGALINAFSWRWIFYINVPIGIAALIIGALRVSESRNPKAPRTDWGGMIALSVALAALLFATIRGPQEGWTSSLTLGLYALSVVFLVIFAVIEARLGERAMLDPAFLRNPTFVGISLVAMIGNAGALPTVFFSTSYLENLLHYDAWETGLRFLPLTVGMLVAGALVGPLIGKVPFRFLLGPAVLVMGVGIVLLQRTEADSSWTVMLPALLLAGIGMGAFNPSRAALAIGITEPARAGVASGVNETFQQVGVAVGIAGVGALFEHQVTESFTSSAVAGQLGPEAADQAASGISAGAIDTVAQAAGPLQQQVLDAAQEAFVTGYHDAMLLAAVLAAIAATVGFLLLRTQDLHASALSAISTVPPDADDADVTADVTADGSVDAKDDGTTTSSTTTSSAV